MKALLTTDNLGNNFYVVEVSEHTIKCVNSKGYRFYFRRLDGYSKKSTYSSIIDKSQQLLGLSSLESFVETYGRKNPLNKFVWKGGVPTRNGKISFWETPTGRARDIENIKKIEIIRLYAGS